MNKLFNKKTKIVYVVLLSLTFILGCVMVGMNGHYSNAFDEATKSDDLTQKVADVISGLASALTSNANGASSSKTDETAEYDDATKAILAKKNATLALAVVSYLLTAVFIGGAIAANEYPKYLTSDKYSAKLKRQEKEKKRLAQSGNRTES